MEKQAFNNPSDLHRLQTAFLKLKNNRYFELFVVFIIIISALEIGAKTYVIPTNLVDFFVYLDYFVTTFFLIEISIRFIAE